MGKFRCLGIPAALFLLATDVSSVTDDKISLIDDGSSSNLGSMSVHQSIDEKGENNSRLRSIKNGNCSGKWRKWIWVIVLVFIVGAFLGIFLPVHFSKTRPAVPDGVTSTGITSNAKYPIATTASATGCYGESGAYLDSTVEQQMEIFVSSESEKFAESFWTAKKDFLKQCLQSWSPENGLRKETRAHLLRWLEREIQEARTRAAKKVKEEFRNLAPGCPDAGANVWVSMVQVEPQESIEKWVKSGSEALEEFKKETDEDDARMLRQILRDEGFEQSYEVPFKARSDFSARIDSHIARSKRSQKKKAEALSYVAQEIRTDTKSLEGAGSMTSIDELLRKKVRKPIDGTLERKIKLYQDKLLGLMKEITGEKKLPKSKVDRIKFSMKTLTEFEEEKLQEKKNN